MATKRTADIMNEVAKVVSTTPPPKKGDPKTTEKKPDPKKPAPSKGTPAKGSPDTAF